MDNPLSSMQSPTPGLGIPSKDNISPGVNKSVKFNPPQIIIEPESRAPEINEQAEDSKPPDLYEPDTVSKPQVITEPVEESRSQDLNEEAKDSTPEDQLEDLNKPDEGSNAPDPNQPAQAVAAQDLKQKTEEEGDIRTEMPPGKEKEEEEEESLLPDRTEGPGMSTSEDHPAPEPSLDDNAQASDHSAQPDKAPVAAVTEEAEPQTLVKKEAPPWIFISATKEKTATKEKGKVTGATQHSSYSSPYGRSSPSSKVSWSPPQLPKATCRPISKPKTVDKATQILPGRVPKLSKIPPKICLPPKPNPKPPHADKATEISPSFEKLLKRSTPLMKKKKKKKEEMSLVSGPHGRLPCAAAGSAPQRVKSAKRVPRVKRAKRAPQRVKRAKSEPMHVRGMPLRVKLSSSSPSKHSLSLSLCSRKKRKIICNLCLTFCENWEEKKPCCIHGTNREESLVSCSGLYRACSVFSLIKHGRIHLSNLLLAVHTLGILVTSEEMRHILHLVRVDGQKSLNFCEFLEAVNTISPFAETEAFQDTLRAFRMMKQGTVTVKELEPILLYLGIILSPKTVRKTLGCTKVSQNGKFDMSDFLLAAEDLQRVREEEDEAFLNERVVFKRRPFQDVADLVDAECRRRIKYGGGLEEEMPTALHRPLFTRQDSAEDTGHGKQQSRTSKLDLGRSSTNMEEAKEGDSTEVTTSQLDLNSDLKGPSPKSSISNTIEENKGSAVELETSQLDPPSQPTEDPIPS